MDPLTNAAPTVGQRIRRMPSITVGDKSSSPAEKRRLALDGVVVYVHPEGHYYTVEYDCPVRGQYGIIQHNRFRESYCLPELPES